MQCSVSPRNSNPDVISKLYVTFHTANKVVRESVLLIRYQLDTVPDFSVKSMCFDKMSTTPVKYPMASREIGRDLDKYAFLAYYILSN